MRPVKALTELFVLAVVLESALAVIFNWRPFLQTFDRRGVKTVISFAFAAALVRLTGFDVIAQLLNAYDPSPTPHPKGLVSGAITALVIAGGSGGVNNLFRALGLRDPARPDEVIPRPPEGKAWFSVRVERGGAKGPVKVLVKPDGSDPEVVGTITGGTRPPRLLSLFLRDATRFPTVAGWPVAAHAKVSVLVEDPAGRQFVACESRAFAPGATIDFEVRL